MKNIVVQDSLVEIKKQLESRGYAIVGVEEGKRVDAIVYTEEYEAIKNINETGEMNPLGVVLINATRKSIDDIVYIIERRKYENVLK